MSTPTERQLQEIESLRQSVSDATQNYLPESSGGRLMGPFDGNLQVALPPNVTIQPKDERQERLERTQSILRKGFEDIVKQDALLETLAEQKKQLSLLEASDKAREVSQGLLISAEGDIHNWRRNWVNFLVDSVKEYGADLFEGAKDVFEALPISSALLKDMHQAAEQGNEQQMALSKAIYAYVVQGHASWEEALEKTSDKKIKELLKSEYKRHADSGTVSNLEHFKAYEKAADEVAKEDRKLLKKEPVVSPKEDPSTRPGSYRQ